jgi:NAD(P)-dependent dehydrogenase (short-subunit alcohol dehydrogenase family)
MGSLSGRVALIANASRGTGAAHRRRERWSACCVVGAGLSVVMRSLHVEYGPLGLRAFATLSDVVDNDTQDTIRRSGLNPLGRLPRGAPVPSAELARTVARLYAGSCDDWAGSEIDIGVPAVLTCLGLEQLSSEVAEGEG